MLQINIVISLPEVQRWGVIIYIFVVLMTIFWMLYSPASPGVSLCVAFRKLQNVTI